MAIEGNLVGQTLGGYRIVGQIGRGGMAVVYKAYEPALDRYVAIKVLPQYFAHDPDFAARFEREAKAVARLHHPNILPIYSVGLDAGLNYIAMQYVEAGTLKEMLGTPLDLKTASEIVGQIGRALDYAHRRGLVHRDVKPANVLIAEGNWVLLTDFGLARIVESSIQITKSGVGVGTPAYMSPEQGQGKTVDARSDVYSLGVVLYEMLTGHVPFDADTPMAIVIKHMTAPLPLPREANPDLPEPVERVLLKALAKDVNGRFQTAQEMVAALEQAVAEAATASPVPPKARVGEKSAPTQAQGGPTEVLDRPLPAAPPAESAPPQSSAMQALLKGVPRWAWGLAAGLVALLVIGALLIATQGPSPTESTPTAVAEAVLSTPEEKPVVESTPGERSASKPTPVPLPDDARPPAESGAAHFAAGLDLLENRQYRAAIEEFNKALGLGYESADLFHNRGWACHELQFFENDCSLEQALEDFTRAIELDPDGAHHYQARSSTYLRLGQPELALADTERATQLNPEDAGTWVDKGWAHLEMGDNRQALAAFNRAVEMDPEDPHAIDARAAAYLRLGEIDAALEDLNRAIEIKPTQTSFWLDRGWAHKFGGNLQAALSDFERAIRLEPDNAEGYRGRGSVVMDMGDPRSAIPDYTRAIKLRPQDTGALRDRAWAYRAAGAYREALEDLNEALRREPEEAWGYIDRAIILDENLGNPDQAIADLNRAVELAPDLVDGYFHRAMFHQRHEEWDAVIADLTRAAEMAPDWPDLYAHLGDAFAQLGDVDQARANFDRFLELTEGDLGFDEWRGHVLEWLEGHP